MKGFTLLEMIVALGIFAVVATISAAVLLSLTDAQNKAFSLQDAYDNLSFAQETMSKDVRTGDTYHCGDEPPLLNLPSDCVSGASSLTYKNSSGALVTYQLSSGHVEKFINGVPAGSLTSDAVSVDKLTFYVLGASAADQMHPRVTIVIAGSAGKGRSASHFNLQTTVSQRKINQ